MEMASVVLYIARMAFVMSVTFLGLCLVAFLLGAGEGERVILTISVALNAIVAVGSMILKKCMLKSEAAFKTQKDAQKGKTKTIDAWLESK